MRRHLVLATALAGLVLAAASAEAGRGTYTCLFSKTTAGSQVLIGVTGNDLTPTLCAALGSGLSAQRVSAASVQPAPLRCAWKLKGADIIVAYFSGKNEWSLCATPRGSLRGWLRIK